MYRLAQRITPITGSILMFLVSAFLVPMMLLLSAPATVRHIKRTMPAPVLIMRTAAQVRIPVYNTLPMALDIPVILVIPPVVIAPVAIILPKITVTGPKTVQRASTARLVIPSIKVNAVIKDMGLTSGGAMAVPGNRVDVGWYSPGTRPGETGSAVIGGHNEWTGGSGVFVDLHQLKIGDVLSVTDAKGVSVSFVVRGMRTFDAADENSGIFASASGAHLNLITCSGVWDPATDSYTTRLVVYTEAMPAALPA